MGRLRALAVVAAVGLLLGSAACDEEANRDGSPALNRTVSPDSVELIEFGGAPLRLATPVERIVALVPSATEALVLLGAGDRLVGRTDYDTAQALATLPSVGGGLQPNLEILRTLEPDVVVAFAGESDVRTGQILAGLGIPVFQVRPSRIADVRTMVDQLGRMVGAPAEAAALLGEMDGTLAEVRTAVSALPRVPFAYLLGGTPPLAAGPDTFLSELAVLAGGVNVLHDLGALYAPVSPEVLRDRNIEVVLMTAGSRIDPRILEGRRAASLPGWVELPGPSLGRSAWEVARALHPDLPGSDR